MNIKIYFLQSLFYSDAKSIDTEEMDQKGRIIYKNIPATGLIEDRLKYLRNKNCISIRKKPRVLDSITNGKFNIKLKLLYTFLL